MDVAAEIGSVAGAAVAGTIDGSPPATTTDNLDTGVRLVAHGTGAGGAVSMECGDDVAAMTARAGRSPRHPTVIFDQVILIIAGVRGVASGAICSKAGVDGISDYGHFRADDGIVAGGARAGRVVGR